MAWLRKKSGRYYARFYDRNRSPKRKELALGCTRKDVARRKLSKLERQYRNETFDPWAPNAEPDALTLSEAISRFMDSRSHLREQTIKSYRSVLRVWKRTDAVSAALQLEPGRMGRTCVPTSTRAT